MRALPRRLGHEEQASLVEHLGELRTRVIIALGSILFWFLLIFFLVRKPLLRWLAEPLGDRRLITLGPSEPFTTSFNVSLYAALALSVPVVLWQVWSFLAPAFEERHQRAVAQLVAVAVVLLAAGMAFAYYIVLPKGLDFLIGFDSDIYKEEVQASRYFSFAAAMIFTVGLLFELPLAVVGLVRLGVLSSAQLRRNRRIGYGLCVVAAVLLPGVDWVSMTLQTAPILALFELSIWASVIAERRAARGGALEPA